jgi:RNA polymerase sigma factor (sigma-70 family)
MNLTQARRNIYQSRRVGAAMICDQARVPTREQLIRDVIKAQSGDTRAREQVVMGTSLLALTHAQKYYLLWASKLPNSADFCDVFQAALIGLNHAIDKYKPETGNSFTTAALPWIRQAVQRQGIYPLLSSVRIPEPVIISGMPIDDPFLSARDYSLDFAVSDTDDEGVGCKTIDQVDMADQAIGTVDAQRLKKRLREIDERLPLAVQMVADGETTAVVGLEFGVSGQFVRNMIGQAREALA